MTELANNMLRLVALLLLILEPIAGFSTVSSTTPRRRDVSVNMLPNKSFRTTSWTPHAAPGSVFIDSASGKAPTAGLLHPQTMAQLVSLQSSDVFRDDPAMAAFLKDFKAGGPMMAMKHLSNSHVTSQLVSMLAEVNRRQT